MGQMLVAEIYRVAIGIGPIADLSWFQLRIAVRPAHTIWSTRCPHELRARFRIPDSHWGVRLPGAMGARAGHAAELPGILVYQ